MISQKMLIRLGIFEIFNDDFGWTSSWSLHSANKKKMLVNSGKWWQVLVNGCGYNEAAPLFSETLLIPVNQRRKGDTTPVST